jgi:DNA-directed RNA polymerase II subunit RPB1
VYQYFKCISDEDCKLLGLSPRHSRPEWIIISVLPIPPPHVRPTADVSGSGIKVVIYLCSRLAIPVQMDRLTALLSNIVEANWHVAVTNGCDLVKAEAVASLQSAIAAYMGCGPDYTSHPSKPVPSLARRLKGRDGRVRGLMRKRVYFSARSVLTCDPLVDLDEVGVPLSIAMTLTLPETVTAWNTER